MRGRSRNGVSRSVDGSRGRPRTRSPRMLRWISSVPPAIDCAGTETRITSAIDAVERASGPAEHRRRRRRAALCTRAAVRAMSLQRELAERALGPGRPAQRPAAAAAAAVHSRDPLQRGQPGDLLAHQRVAGAPGSAAVAGDEVGPPGPLRVPAVGRERAPSASPTRLAERPAACGLGTSRRPHRRAEPRARGPASSARPSTRRRPRRPRCRPGPGRRSMNTSLNEAWPFICRSGRTSTPGWCIGSTK